MNRQARRAAARHKNGNAVARAPERPDTALWLAAALEHQQAGRWGEAGRFYERAIEADPDNARAHFVYGAMLHDAGDPGRAIDSYLRAMQLAPDLMEAHYNFCAALMALGQFDAAADYYEQLLALKPDFIAGYSHLALAYNGAGKPRQALVAVRRGLKISETPFGKSVFVQCLRGLDTADNDLRDLIVRAVSEPWTRPNELTRHCIALLKADAQIASCIARAVAAWPARLPARELYGPSGLRTIAGDALMRAFLENSRVSTLDMEQFLTAARAALLEAAETPAAEADDDTLAYYCAVARQCFIAEYAFLHDEDEFARAGALKEKLDAALRADEAVAPIRVAAVAAYLPLHALAERDRLLARAPACVWPAPVEALLTQQIREPAEERRLRATIPAITPIEDQVSVEVRNQYEEHPYPRWVEAPTLEQPVSIAKHVRGLFPFADFRPPPSTGAVDLLVAGCGTGQSVINYARRFAHARVLAVDLSLTSLSYAKRKIAALGLPHVELAQADILKLGSLDRQFDVINCSGVLHHLGDPMKGWRTLLSLLKPDGIMSVALYSELARTDYVAAQKMIAERGYGRSADEIRRFRRDLIAGEKSKTYYGVLGCADFFTISACRDLLFHAQEHRMTIPQLKAFFDENELNFLGFEIDQAVKQHYAARFPGDRTLTDLDNWHVYEQENPYTFLRMYQFWIQPRRRAG